jgi:hypothetical protein
MMPGCALLLILLIMDSRYTGLGPFVQEAPQVQPAAGVARGF